MSRSTLVGIINLTPDSFSDGGECSTTEQVLLRCQQLIEDGAKIIDVGAESTRPGAKAITAEEEWQRLFPNLGPLIALAHHQNAQISLDTRHPETAQKALAMGIDWLNDVSGFSSLKMITLAKDSDAKLVVMHNLGIPADKRVTIENDEDPVAEVYRWGSERLELLDHHNIHPDRVIFDPGIGFGKTASQSLALIKRIFELQTLGTALLVGHSRKSFLQEFTASPAADRDPETVIASLYLAKHKVEYLRVHNVALHQRAFALAKELGE